MNIRKTIWKYGKSERLQNGKSVVREKDPPSPLDLCVALYLLNRLLSGVSIVGKENWPWHVK